MTSITIEIESKWVTEITNAQQVVTLVQMVNSGAQSISASKKIPLSSNTCIIWGVSQPFQNFDFTWIESYYWYCSTTAFKLWNIISNNSSSDQIESQADIFQFSSNIFSFYRSETDSLLFQLYNFGPEACFGLAQDLTVNNTRFEQAPISGITALSNELVQCGIEPRFAVILSSYNEPGKVITPPSQSSFFTINNGDSLTLKYDGTQNKFVRAQ